MSATNFMEAALGDALFLSQPFPTVTTWNVCLYSQTPNEGGIGIEISGNGYAPVANNPGGGRWIKDAAQSAGGETVYRNGVAVQFPVATADWPLQVVAFGLKNQNGELCFAAALSANKTIASGEQAVFLAGELEIRIG